MSFPVDDQEGTALLLRSLHGFLHGSEEKIGSDDGAELSVGTVNRFCADQAQFPGIGVSLHIREDQFPGLHGLLVPEAGAGIIVHQGTVFQVPGGSVPADGEEYAFRQGDIDIVRIKNTADVEHQVRHVRGKSGRGEHIGVGRIGVFREDDIGRKLPFLGRVRPGVRPEREVSRVGKQSGCDLADQFDPGFRVRENIIRGHCFQPGDTAQVAVYFFRHHGFGDFCNGLLLLPAGFA